MPVNLNFKFKFTFNRYQLWRYISIFIFGLLFAAFLGTAIFLYNYIYRRLDDAHTIVILSSDQSVDLINLNNYQKAVNLINLKASTTPITLPLRNIFLQPPTSTAATITSTTPNTVTP